MAVCFDLALGWLFSVDAHPFGRARGTVAELLDWGKNSLVDALSSSASSKTSLISSVGFALIRAGIC